jgi:hypothetical protein
VSRAGFNEQRSTKAAKAILGCGDDPTDGWLRKFDARIYQPTVRGDFTFAFGFMPPNQMP